MGATQPEEYGNHYAWGEIDTKTTYDWSTYKHANGRCNYLTKYCDETYHGNDGFTDALTTLESADDAATQNWGGNWRIPTIDEWEELIEKCTWTWVTKNYMNGYEVKAANGNSIFLPAAGIRNGGELNDAGSYGGHWSSSLETDYEAQDVGLCFFHNGTDSGDRYYGLSVRPVLGK